MKALGLISLLPRRPSEFFDRISTIIDARSESLYCRRPAYRTTDPSEAINQLAGATNFRGAAQHEESALAEIEARVREQAIMSTIRPFGSFHDGDTALARFCYATARILRPKFAIETGVGYGVTTAYLLQALDVNGQGRLDSIDLPPLGEDADTSVGSFIPQKLRSRWTLHRGTTRRLLGPLVHSLHKIDLFVHDSLHTYRNMTMEFDLAWEALRPGGVMIADDIEGNRAFLELAEREDVAASFVIREEQKASLFGVALKRA
jgi:predicted O-methyltransferase YrrM